MFTMIFLVFFLTISFLIWLFLNIKNAPTPYYPPTPKQSRKNYYEYNNYRSNPPLPVPLPPPQDTQEYFLAPPRASIALSIATYSPPSYDDLIVDQDDDTIK